MNSAADVSPFSWTELCADAIASVKNCDLSSEIQIPTFPAALTEFMQAAEDPNVEFRTLGKIIEHDPGLTLDLLKCVNMCKYSAQSPVRNTTEALLRMGISSARAYLMVVGMQSSLLSFGSKLMNHRNFWNEAMQKALFAQSAAELLNTDRSFAFMGGLLQDYILPVLTNQFDDDYIAYLKGEGSDGMPMHEWEESRFGWNHATAGAFIASRWHLPDDLLCAIYHHHDMDFPLKAAQPELFSLFPATLAALLPDQLRQVPNGMERLLRADSQSKAFDLNSLCEQVDNELESIAQGSELPARLTPAVAIARLKSAESV